MSLREDRYMNAVVIYDSHYGNTERIAQAIADTLCTYGPTTAIRFDPVQPVSLQRIDLLVVGCPTQGFRPTPVMTALLDRIPPAVQRNLAVACFDTRFHGWLWQRSAARVMARQLQRRGVELLVPPESFFVKATKKEGPLLPRELQRAHAWAHMLAESLQAVEPVLYW
jgi:flavorubredoxin